jgi:hypothetical protein
MDLLRHRNLSSGFAPGDRISYLTCGVLIVLLTTSEWAVLGSNQWS